MQSGTQTTMRLYYQITVSFLPFLIFVFITSGMLQVAVIYQTTMNNAQRQLESVAVLMANRLEHAFEMQEAMLGSLTSRTKLRASMQNWSEQAEPTARDTVKRILLDAQTGTRHVLALHALDPDKRVIASTTTLETGAAYRPPRPINETGASGVATEKPGNQLALFGHLEDGSLVQILVGPAYRGGVLVGYLVVEVDPIYITQMEADYAGMGESGETMLAQRNNEGDAEFLSPLRFPDQSITGNKVLRQRERVPINLALEGQELFLAAAPDYRGEIVVAHTRALPRLGLGLATKMDRAEILRPVIRLTWVTLAAMTTAIFIAVMISRWLARSIAAPLEALTAEARKLLKAQGGTELMATEEHEVGVLKVTIKRLMDRLYRAEQNLAENKVERVMDELSAHQQRGQNLPGASRDPD